ncbi:MAG: hypothetical protein ACXWER_04355, partial [Halobacteriota archaeon]
MRQDESIKLEHTREATLIAHNIHLNLIEVNAVHGLLPTVYAGALFLEAPCTIFQANRGHRRCIRSVNHASHHVMTLSATCRACDAPRVVLNP